jgi:hypothetical protein
MSSDAPTLYDPKRMPGQPTTEEAPPAPEATGAPAAVPPATDKWGAIEQFAGRVDGVLAIEREVALVLERRQTLGRRLVDASKRRDEAQAAESTEAWIRTEVQMDGLMKRYEAFSTERRTTLKLLGIG